MKEPFKFNLGFLVAIAVFMVVIVFNAAYGDDGHGHDHHDGDGGDTVVNTDVVTGDLVGGDTNVSTGGNRALALSNNMGDVDIADCLGSTQFGTPLFSKQKLVINNVCLAEFYLNMKKYDLAAMALCNVPGIIKEFDSEEECESAHDFAPVYEAAVIVEEDYEDEWREEQMQMQIDYDQRIDHLEQLVQQKPAPRVTRQVIQKPFLTDEKRAKLQAVLDEDEE